MFGSMCEQTKIHTVQNQLFFFIDKQSLQQSERPPALKTGPIKIFHSG